MSWVTACYLRPSEGSFAGKGKRPPRTKRGTGPPRGLRRDLAGGGRARPAGHRPGVPRTRLGVEGLVGNPLLSTLCPQRRGETVWKLRIGSVLRSYEPAKRGKR